MRLILFFIYFFIYSYQILSKIATDYIFMIQELYASFMINVYKKENDK